MLSTLGTDTDDFAELILRDDINKKIVYEPDFTLCVELTVLVTTLGVSFAKDSPDFSEIVGVDRSMS